MRGSVPARRFVVATANPDKAREIEAILEAALVDGSPVDGATVGGRGPDVELVTRPSHVPDVEETGATLEENARLKAVALARATGLPAIADDTGLEVDALGGAPGVYTARYAGEAATYRDNVDKLLAELASVDSGGRAARFTTVALVAWPDGRELVARGSVEGVIAPAAQGDGGFGYDPVFVPEGGGGRTFAEMTASEKASVSHRGRAFRTLAAELSARWAGGVDGEPPR